MRRLVWWPRSLSSRMACILVLGLFAAQALTSTIWLDRRHGELMEVPGQIVAARVADMLRLMGRPDAPPADRLLAMLRTPSFDPVLVRFLPSPMPGVAPATQDLVQDVVRNQVGHAVEVRVTRADLLDDNGRGSHTLTLLCARTLSVRYTIYARLPSWPHWLRVDALEGENGGGQHCFKTIGDYLLRIYLIRMLIVIGIALLAVRLAMKPLGRMARAAEALGGNLNHPPLGIDGPVEVRQAAEAFNRMQQRLVEAMKERSRFLAAVSHDLRSPITRLRLRTELLRQEDLREKFRKDLAEMEVLVNATLVFVQGVEGEMEAAPVEIGTMLRELVENLREQGGDITLTGEVSAPLWGFAHSLRRCFQNLAENALRYAGSAQIIVEDSRNALNIAVLDRGPGIPPGQLEQVFEPFVRLEGSRNPASGGVGLGLSIVRTVALAHGGTVRLENRPDGGLKASVVLRRRPGD
ncbi:ATP-binding protein [Novosphingobium rosa]|uniref:ATP-binding protein n=1 Tax=Novosphingobium rosa TaxID=76978 RepID=UPI00082DDEAF|nr:ATP-binding protein [Novosphingobium rosa]